MSDRKLTPMARELIAAKNFLSDEGNWCPEGEGFNGIDGKRLCAIRAAIRFCSLGPEMLSVLAVEVFGVSAVQVNRMGHAAVLKLYDHAIARALSEGK